MIFNSPYLLTLLYSIIDVNDYRAVIVDVDFHYFTNKIVNVLDFSPVIVDINVDCTALLYVSTGS